MANTSTSTSSATSTVESTTKEVAAPPTPNRFIACLQVVAAFCIFFNSWGLLNSFGTFQAFYQRDILSDVSASDISWIGTVQSSFIMIGSVWSGPLYDTGHLRTLIFTGCFCLVLGMFLTSICHVYWQFLLAQGFLIGIGLGCLFMPTTGVLAMWFDKRRGLAMGLATSGSALGGIIYPIVFYRLVPSLGFGWTIRIIAFLTLLLSLIPVAGMRSRFQPRTVRKLFDKTVLREPDYVLFTFATFFGYLGLYIPYFYIQLYSESNSLITDDLNFYLLAVMNAAGFFGRIAIGGSADFIGPINAFILDVGICTVLVFVWCGISTAGGIICFCILYGFFSAGVVTLPATIVAVSMCPDMRQYGVRMMMPMVPIAFGLLIGNPIAGALLPHGWLALQLFTGASLAMCTLLAVIARFTKVGTSLKAKC